MKKEFEDIILVGFRDGEEIDKEELEEYLKTLLMEVLKKGFIQS